MKRLLAIMLALLTGCAALPEMAVNGAAVSGATRPAVPRDFNAVYLGAQKTIAAIANGAATLRTAGRLSDEDRDNVVKVLVDAESGLQLAKTLRTADPVAGMSKLDASVAILTALQNYLLTKELKK